MRKHKEMFFQRNTLLLQATILFLTSPGYHLEIITVTERQIALLPCSASLTVKRTHAKPTLLRWFHSRYHKPIYTLDVRLTKQLSGGLNRSAIDAKHFPSHEFEGRLYLEQHSSPLALRIDPVQFEDNGRLTCRIDFKARRSVYSSVDLQVIVPPQEILIRDQSGRKLTGVIGPFNLGESLVVTCEALGGKPLPMISWSGTFDNSSGEFKVNVTENSASIFIPCLQRTYQWTHYTCTASNNNISIPKSQTVTLEINLPPHTVEMESNLKTPLTEGQLLYVSCSSNGSHPKAHMHWYMDGQSVTSKEVITDGGRIVTSYHSRKAAALDNGKLLECIVTNPSVPSYIVKRSYSMVVYFKPYIKTSLPENTSDLIVAGSDITIACKVNSNPILQHKTWLFEGKSVLGDNVHLNTNRDLTIKSIRSSQAGVYTCIATNSQGSSNSSISVDVNSPPVCKQIEMSAKYHGRQDRDDFCNVTCSLYADPWNVTFYWTTRNSSSNHSWSTGGDSHAKLKCRGDLIELLCWGENEIGIQKIPCRLEIRGGKNDVKYHIGFVFVGGFIAIIFVIILWMIIKQILQIGGSNFSSQRTRNIKDSSCSQMINNCVKSAGSPAENECLTTLLTSEHKKEFITRRNDTEEKDFFRCQLESNVELRSIPNDRTRRIKSSQF